MAARSSRPPLRCHDSGPGGSGLALKVLRQGTARLSESEQCANGTMLAGAGRQRRMRGGGARGGSRSVWTVARLQRIGNWGRADEALGRQWEVVGLAALAALLDVPRAIAAGTYVPRAVVALAEDEAMRREVHATGL